MTRKKLMAVVGLLIALPLATYLGYRAARNAYFHPGVPTPDYPAPADAVEARRQDVHYLRHYLDLDRSYSDSARGDAHRLLAELEARAAGSSEAEFQLGVSRIVALADNGHSNVWAGLRAERFGRLPFRGYFFDDGFYILRTLPQHAALLGGRVVRLDDTPFERAVAAVRPHVGGTDEYFRSYPAETLFGVPALLAALGVVRDAASVVVTVELAGGRTVSQTLAPSEPGVPTPNDFSWRYLAPRPLEHERDWSTYIPPDSPLPLFLQEIELPYRHAPLPEIAGYYVQYRRNRDVEGGASIAEFQREVRAAIRRRAPRVIVLDQRFNGGGDYTETRRFMEELPDLLPGDGRIYIATGMATFSAGIHSVAFAIAAAHDRAILIGGRVGDRERSWAETNDFELPNSNMGMRFSTGMHDLRDGCHDWRRCYWTDLLHNVAVGSLDPQIPVPYEFRHYHARRDPVLDAIIARETRR